MKVHRDLNNLPFFKNAAITIGTFDGVHTGHLQIIHQLKKEAQLNSGESVIITFDPHPRMVLNSTTGQPKIKLLNTLTEKIELLTKQEIDHLVIVPFSLEFSNQSAQEYISDFLVSKFHPETIIIGYDHRFGKNRTGDYKLLEKYQASYNYKVKEIPEHVLHHVTISSTKIRHALSEDDISTANEYLGYDYFFEGRVVDGNKLGRTLGYPTANIDVVDENKLVPGNGIYAVEVSIGIESKNQEIEFIESSKLKGMMSIGIRPTIGGNDVVIEVNIFDFDEEIYNRVVRVYVKKFLRKEEKFDSLEELKKAIDDDKRNALQVLKALS
ncbi:MAG: bifunctional riboflavin kinase/FAD synthetase [Bacteroidota bacterium]|nr:bifunctional riboflavin kinase/FAD synthetase [Bacteroidota bacterium]